MVKECRDQGSSRPEGTSVGSCFCHTRGAPDVREMVDHQLDQEEGGTSIVEEQPPWIVNFGFVAHKPNQVVAPTNSGSRTEFEIKTSSDIEWPFLSREMRVVTCMTFLFKIGPKCLVAYSSR